MYTLKENVSNQLSRFFAESQNSSSPLPSPCSSADTSQARPFSDGGKSFSSYFHFTVPSLNFGGSGSNKHQHELKPIHSRPFRWGSKGLKQEDEHSVRYHECNTVSEDENLKNYCEDSKESIEVSVNKQTDKTLDSNDVGASGRSSSDSDVFEEAREQQTPRSPVFHLMNESSFISSELYDFLHSSLPNIVKGCQWVLLYSTLKHGISLPDTYSQECRSFRSLFVGANRYYYMCLNDLLALGGGCNFALCLDGDLLNGTSGPCETFGNLCLAHQPEFVLKNVEVI
ncbi:hypothetical protein GH714_005417 [Hevea brasiliensis]|uniref:TLDc domain-containing protein n=1 Tax=Hevea brasiliensis TaxID=3981 RepID=A0A6A6K9S1_HEVBR|nr:hypothetical protein GH714_005417 [Hevea brasiliensis]